MPGDDQRNPDAGIRLDDLRGNQGTQYYEVPGDTINSDEPWTVLVWCEIFDVPIAKRDTDVSKPPCVSGAC